MYSIGSAREPYSFLQELGTIVLSPERSSSVEHGDSSPCQDGDRDLFPPGMIPQRPPAIARASKPSSAASRPTIGARASACR